MTEPLYTNRLIQQKSPYLLQHSHNPVDWYPWGEEAFQASIEENKPIFLSIGYATCHWCHVMERESFENIEVAELMNRVFVNIKVDREELPDVDSLYMEFAQSMMSGAAGWPLNVILTPDLQPFFATTYLPAYSGHGMMGLIDLIQRISELWTSEERDKIISQAEKIVEVFEESIHVKGEDLPEYEYVTLTADLLYKMADPIYGGIKGEPKFPIGYQYSFMLGQFAASKDARALYLVEKTLNMMHRGGIYDHLGGGFSRYSVDERWLVPHFEKMLYDNAILAQTYLEAWKVTKNPTYRQICEEILNYVLRDMTHPKGGFYSAEDSDSEGREGLFYTWTHDEIQQILGDQAERFCRFYNVTPEGNFEERNILNTPLSLEEFSAQENIDLAKFKLDIEKQKKILWEVRKKRVHPFKDDKVLTGWNGLMIYSLTEAALAFDQVIYLQAAVKAAHFIKNELWKDNQLLRRWRDGQSMFRAGLDEYSFLIRGLISLFEANAGADWLLWAVEMTDILEEHYKEEDGAFFQTDGSDPHLIIRKCQFSDGAEPSGNAIQTENLLRLYLLTNQMKYLEQAEDVLRAVKVYLESYSPGYCFHVMNIERYDDETAPTVVIALNSKKDLEEDIKHLIFQRYLPHKAIIWQSEDVELEELLPFIQDKESIDDQTTLYICYQGSCQKPLTTLSEIRLAIEKL